MFDFLMKKFKIHDIVIFLTTFITGLISYTYMYVNLPNNSDTFIKTIGYSHDKYYLWEIQCGRWARALMTLAFDSLGYYNVVPFFNFIISIILISLSLVILFYIFEIDNLIYKILFSCIFITTPVIVENMSFYFYIVPTCIGLVFTMLSMYLIIKKYKFIFGSVLLCIAIGMYQPFFFLAATIMLIYYLNQIIKDKNFDIIIFIKRKYKMFLALAVSLIVYIIINKIFLMAFNIMTGGRFGNFISIENIKMLFLKMYGAVLILPFKSYAGLNTTLVSKILFFIMYVYMFIKLILILKNNKLGKNIIITLFLLTMPIAMNSFMIVGETVTIRTLIADMMIFLLFIIFANIDTSVKVNKNRKEENKLKLIFDNIINKTNTYKTNVNKISGIIVIGVLSLFLFHYIYYANAYAYHSKLSSDATRSWCIELVSNIKNKNFYTTDKKIAIIGDIKKLDMSDYYVYGDTDIIPTATMGFVSLVEWSFIDSIKEYGAFSFKLASTEEINKIKNTDRFKNQMCYPNYNGIELYDDIIVVKISD